MNLMFAFLIPVVLVGVGGGVGALVRFGIIQWSSKYIRADSHIGILLTNVIGCILLGMLLAVADKYTDVRLKLFLLTGFLGGMTTFSTFVFDIHRLSLQKGLLNASGYIFLTLVFSYVGFIVSYHCFGRLLRSI